MNAQIQPAATPRFVKENINGDDVVREPGRALMWDPSETKRMTIEQAEEYVKNLRLGGFDDWRLPTVEESFLLADRTRHDPAIDTEFFPKCKSDWYATSSPFAADPVVIAWFVNFGYGNAGWSGRDCKYFVRAVRASQ